MDWLDLLVWLYIVLFSVWAPVTVVFIIVELRKLSGYDML